MKKTFAEQRNGLLETIQAGLDGIRSFRDGVTAGTGTHEENLLKLRHALQNRSRFP